MLRMMKKMTLGLLSAGVMVFTVIPTNAKMDETVKYYDYHFCPHEITDEDYTDQMAYTDNYFVNPSSTYNEHLATASMSLAASSISANTVRSNDLQIHYYQSGTLYTADATSTGDLENYWYKSENLQELLTGIGFQDFEVNYNYVTQPSEQTIGTGVAYKTIDVNGEAYTLIAIVPRSAGYEKEWSGNFTIGEGTASEGFAEGFYNARQETVQFSAEYIQRHALSGKVKIWTVGYSRGAATANLTAGWYADHVSDSRLSNISYQPTDIYAYTFGTPAGVYYGTDETIKAQYHTNYPGIYSVFAPYDPVSMLALDGWGFTRYGTDVLLDAGYNSTTHQDTNNEAMKAQLKKLNTTVYSIYNNGGDPNIFSPKKIAMVNGSIQIVNDDTPGIKNEFLSQEEFLQGRLSFLQKNILNDRTEYVKYQPVLQAFMVIYLGDYSDRPGKFMANLGSNTVAKAGLGGLYITYVASRCISSLLGETDITKYADVIADLKLAAQYGYDELNNLTQTEVNVINQYITDNLDSTASLNVDSLKAILITFRDNVDTIAQLSNWVEGLKKVAVQCLGVSVMQAMELAGYTKAEIVRLVGANLDDAPLASNMGYFAKLLAYLLFGSDGISTDGEQYNIISTYDEGGQTKLAINFESDQMKVLATMVGNGGSYMRVHNNEVILAWLRTQDSYYKLTNYDDDYVAPDTSVKMK